jgi:molybdopterin converting factor small subunit
MTGGARIQDFRDGRHEAALSGNRLCHNRAMRMLRMKPGHGEVLLAEGDVQVSEELDALVAEFRAQIDSGMWAAVPTTAGGGRREAQLVRSFDEVPRDADRVIFFPQAAGGR